MSSVDPPFQRAVGYAVKSYESHAFLRFLLLGGVNTLFGYGVFCLTLWFWPGASSIGALVLSTILGTLFNFMTTGHFVFRDAKMHRLGRFVVVYAVIFVFNYGGLHLMERANVAPVLAQAGLLPFLVTLSFLLNRSFVFNGA